MYSKKLKDHPGCQCHVEFDGFDDEMNYVEFISYNTTVAIARRTDFGWGLAPMEQYWDGYRVYTPTTAKQISYFLREYFPGISYQQFKRAAIDDEVIAVF